MSTTDLDFYALVIFCYLVVRKLPTFPFLEGLDLWKLKMVLGYM